MYIQEAPASQDASFETHRSPRQDLTFDTARALFGLAGTMFDQGLMLDLGIVDASGAYTNLGLLLSDQNPFEIRCAVYGDIDPATASKRRAFAGSLPQQVVEALSYCEAVEPGAYPAASLRAALVNAAVHRDYAYNGPVLVNFHPDFARVVSVGGLVGELTVDDALQGVSATRNPGLAAVLDQLGLFEGYGAGLQTIVANYTPTGHSPQLEAATCSFVVVLPNLTRPAPAAEPQAAKDSAPQTAASSPAVTQSSGVILGAAPQGEKMGADRYDNALTQELLKHLVRKPKQE